VGSVLEQSRCHTAPGKAPPQRGRPIGAPDDDPIIYRFESNICTRAKASPLAQLLGNYDLPLCTDPLCHTTLV